MGDTAFQRGLGWVHALAHPLGALYTSRHGLLNAILMPYVLNANRSAIEAPLTRLARYLELQNPGFDSFFAWILTLREQLRIPQTLSEIGINQDRAQEIGVMAFNDAAASGNPIVFTAAQYAEVFVASVNGVS